MAPTVEMPIAISTSRTACLKRWAGTVAITASTAAQTAVRTAAPARSRS